MEDLRKIIGNNLTELRKRAGLTQFELAEKFNYTDRAVSKWENGDTLPDVEILFNLCEFYGVTLDYLTHEDNSQFIKEDNELKLWNKIVISILTGMIVWGLATILFVISLLRGHTPLWQAFVWAVPLSAAVALWYNRAYFNKRRINFIGWSLFVWGVLAGTFLSIQQPDFWPLFLLGIPAEMSLIIFYLFKKPIKKH